MAILQALITFLTKSLGKAVNAIFGWAVLALFGQTSPKEQTMLSAVVAAAAAWPLLAVGTIFPKTALLVIAFVPLAKSVPSLWLRVAWIALALLVPFIVGTVMAARSPQDRLPESTPKKILRGFQVTFALAAAFFMMLVITPILKIVDVARGRKTLHVPAVMDKRFTAEAMQALASELRDHDVELHRARAPWQMTTPSKILLKLGGPAFSSMASDRPEYRRGEQLEVAVLPNETVLRGKPKALARAQALCSEVYGPRPAIQTFNAQAQALEKQIKRVWSVYRESPLRHRDSVPLRARVDEIARDLSRSDDLPWDEWQLVYRLLLQLDRALRGATPLLSRSKEGLMPKEPEKLPLPGPANLTPLSPSALAEAQPMLQGLSNRELISHVVQSATLLAKKEIELAKTELKADLKRETAMAKGLGTAGLCALFTVNMMLVACALALGTVMAEWGAALLVAGVVLMVGTVAGLAGWAKRVKSPLEATRRTLKEDVVWAKERLA